MNGKIIRLRRALFSLTSFLLGHLVIIFLLLILCGLIFLGIKTKKILAQAGLGQFIPLESTNGRTNFLIMGIRGEGSDSPDLTDTLLVVSYSHLDKRISFISIPRDLWVSSLKTKINSVYHYGQFKDQNGGGIKLAQSSILETIGLPIHYSAVINFTIFREAIDLVGGIDINVVNTFTDNQYPIEGNENALPVSSRYESITFTAGMNHMDGNTALKFVRSRHAEGEEGTDIGRDRRQQQVIAAIKQKVFTFRFLTDRNKIIALYQLVKSRLDTNLTQNLYPSLVHLALDSYRHPQKTIVLSYTPDEHGVTILENPPVTNTYLNQWVLVAKDKNWPALAQYLKNKLEEK